MIAVPGFACPILLAVDREGAEHLLHSIFSVPATVYSVTLLVFILFGCIQISGIPLLFRIMVDTFAVQRSVSAVPRADYSSHLGRVQSGKTMDWWDGLCEISVYRKIDY